MGVAVDAPADAPADRGLVVDDEADIVELLAWNLRQAGFVPDTALTGADALASAKRIRPAIVLLDVLLPDVDGTAVCKQLREDPETSGVAIVLLTAKSGESARVAGFEAGADDYVAKPFSVRDVILRVRALSRHGAGARPRPAEGSVLRWRDLTLDLARERVFGEGRDLELRPLEYRLLRLLFSARGRVFSRADLLREVWGIHAERVSQSVDGHVRRVRQRLGVFGEAVETVHGCGYRLRDA
jgi:two-component system, OmpR family, phosphate regulon response regulator PhoB